MGAASSKAARAAYYSRLPRKRVAAACVLRDNEGAFLVVKPTYKPGWELPGGNVEFNESPYDACRREVQEELGLTCQPEQLLGVDYQTAIPGERNEALSFVFDGGILTPTESQKIQLAPDELADWRFVQPERLASLLLPRAARCVITLTSGASFRFLEDGEERR